MKSRANEVDAYLRSYAEEKNFSGIVRVTSHDEIVYSGAFGKASYESGAEFTDVSMFSFYSLSKPFCAIGLLALYDKGLVDIDAHPSLYLPEAKGFDPRVKIRHMLHHVSGIPDLELSLKDIDDKDILNKSVREQLLAIAKLPMVFEPNTRGMYVNANFVISSLIIESVTGLDYAEYMKKEVFTPLGMKTAVVDTGCIEIPNRVQGYEYRDGRVAVDKATLWMKGAGDIVGTADDVYRLNHAIKHKLLLKPETWEMALTPSRLNHMGMGCTVVDWYGKHRIIHNGGHTGFRTLHVQLPEYDFDIIILSNNGWGDARNEISAALHDIYFGEHTTPNVAVAMDTGYAKP